MFSLREQNNTEYIFDFFWHFQTTYSQKKKKNKIHLFGKRFVIVKVGNY